MLHGENRNGRRRYSWGLALAFSIIALISGAVGIRPANAAIANVGYKDFAFGSANAPTGEKPQSKLWFNDGIWWGVMYNKASTSSRFEIYRFNWATDTWTTTGVPVDARTKSSADALWTGSKLYIVSNVAPGATGDVKIYLMRYSYNTTTKTYSVDSGFPVAVHHRGVETVVIDQDSTGRLWVTFTDANSSGGRNAYVSHTTTNDNTWITPYVVPVAGSNTLKSDDISTLVAYSGNIGVMWSNQKDSTVYFAYHPDGTADNNWISNPAVQGPKYADDHLNIKSLQADSAGQLYAVVKTSLNDVESSTSTKPLVLLLQLDTQGSWSRRTVWRVVDNVTRPIVLLDQENRTIYAFTTVNYGSQNSGAIYYKSVSLDSPGMQFVDGLGTPFIVFSTDTHINNASSTKQVLNNTTNLLVIAGDDTSNYYFHNKIVFGTGNPAPTSTAIDTSTPTTTATLGPTPTATNTPAPTNTNTPGPTPTPTSTMAVSDLIFADGFETGNLSAWSANVPDSGSLSVTGAAALAGSSGLQAAINDNNVLSVTSDHPNAEPRYRARFYFDPNSIGMASGDSHIILRGYSGSSTVSLRVEFGSSSGAYRIRAGLVDDGGTWTETSWLPLSDAPHVLELDWRAASGAGASNGGLTFWIDGSQQADLIGIDNDTRRIDRVLLGALASIDAGTRGIYYFDAFESRRQSYIGP